MKPRFSIITCTKNSEEYLKYNIDSVASQTFGNYEHIFVDGESTDRTIEIIEEYKNKFPDKVSLVSRPAKGISNAMNEGTMVTKGEYLIHLHSDDRLHDKEVLTDVDLFLKQNNCDWIYGKETRINPSGTIVKTTNRSKCSRFSSRSFLGKYLLKFHSSINHQSVFIKRQVFEQYGYFDESIKCPMDYDFFLRIRNKTRWMFFDRLVDVFVMHGQNWSLAPENAFENSVETYLVQDKYLNIIEYPIKYLIDLIILIIGANHFSVRVKKEARLRRK
ncbi:MAG: glycosyltransferase family 2 protein [Candidatus Paceibacterota bacterium]|jgi:glycosyltransferase involved in cell wall biosynthesis